MNMIIANVSLQDSRTYKHCQSMLLKEEIKKKRSIILKQKKEFEIVRIVLKRPYHCLILHISLVCFILVMTVNW